MSRDKQIEEMAELIYKDTDLYNVDTAYDISTVLHDAGYRKASEVARVIFEEIEKEIEEALKSNYKVLPHLEFSNELYNSVRGKIDALRGIENFIAELKKKYTESEDKE